ncbi:Na(+)/H(+) antiporter NhaD [Candidatus Terasakiella magnetica]|nr:Na(+)/H(+) antiporter NhaD [Candidatus Terasakiella magnetica]
MRMIGKLGVAALTLAVFPGPAWAAGAALDLSGHWVGWLGLAIFVVAYGLVIAEERTDLRKSKPVVVAAGLMWALVAGYYVSVGQPDTVEPVVRHALLEYGELLLFLLVAMTYVNCMEERLVFDAMRSWMIRSGFSYRTLFWITGTLAFFISPVCDNMTTALLMCAVVMAVGVGQPKFVALSCINIVVAANAGGAFCPFGDITTLMVWQKGAIPFSGFFLLFVPAAVNYLIPAACMHFAMPGGAPAPSDEVVAMRRGARVIIALFVVTIAAAVLFHNFLHLPPVLGMMTGFGFLKVYAYFLRRVSLARGEGGYDIFPKIARVEWDTLLFFYGVMMCVGALGFFGYLSVMSHLLYGTLGPTTANIAIGLASAVLDNIPLMFAVLTMHPDMSQGQWLLITLTTGVGGSLLSIGSAAGVALMGQARGIYTFSVHMRWSWAVGLGYVGSILAHMAVNAASF